MLCSCNKLTRIYIKAKTKLTVGIPKLGDGAGVSGTVEFEEGKLVGITVVATVVGGSEVVGGGFTLGPFVGSNDVGIDDVGCCIIVGVKLNTPSPTGFFVDTLVGGIEYTASPTGRFVGLEVVVGGGLLLGSLVSSGTVGSGVTGISGSVGASVEGGLDGLSVRPTGLLV